MNFMTEKEKKKENELFKGQLDVKHFKLRSTKVRKLLHGWYLALSADPSFLFLC